MKEVKEIMGGIIKKSRLKKMLTCFELAEKLRVSVTYINRIENNREVPSLRLTCLIAKVLDLNEEEFITVVRRSKMRFYRNMVNKRYTK